MTFRRDRAALAARDIVQLVIRSSGLLACELEQRIADLLRDNFADIKREAVADRTLPGSFSET